MSAAMIGLVMFLLMFVLVIIGVPIFVSMMSTACLGFFLISGPTMMLTQLTNAPFTLAASYSYAVLPLFTLMGMLASETGIAEGAYSAARTWLARRRGGLLYTTVLANAIFGACSGISTAGQIVFAKIALPELDKYGYERRLSLGCITSSASLSTLIPPSIPVCMFCLMSGYSIGTTLVCGLGTGIFVTLAMFAVIRLMIALRPGCVPAIREEDRHITMRQKLASLRLLLPIFVLFALIIGGTFLGWFHATVGGAIGAAAVIIYALFKRIPMKKVGRAAWEGGHIFAGIYPIIIAGTIFSRLVTLSGLPKMLITFFESANFASWMVYLLVLVYFIFCGCVMDIIASIVISVPIIFPLLVDSYGYDPFVLIIILVIVSSTAAITPPIGMGVFTVSNATRISPKEIFIGSTPFVIMYFIIAALLIFVPQIVTWLPNLLGVFA